jgi:hypothetical protein
MAEETAAERLRLAIDMFEFGVRMQRARLHRTYPAADDAVLDAAVQEWLLERPRAALGDAPGSPSTRFA